MLPDGAREMLLEAVYSARDRLVVTWLHDGGIFSRVQSPCASVVL